MSLIVIAIVNKWCVLWLPIREKSITILHYFPKNMSKAITIITQYGLWLFLSNFTLQNISMNDNLIDIYIYPSWTEFRVIVFKHFSYQNVYVILMMTKAKTNILEPFMLCDYLKKTTTKFLWNEWISINKMKNN